MIKPSEGGVSAVITVDPSLHVTATFTENPWHIIARGSLQAS